MDVVANGCVRRLFSTGGANERTFLNPALEDFFQPVLDGMEGARTSQYVMQVKSRA